jgi:hypothetical protein
VAARQSEKVIGTGSPSGRERLLDVAAMSRGKLIVSTDAIAAGAAM